MSRMMIQAAVTMNQLQHKLDLVGNNLANSDTTGYKKRHADFHSLLFQQIDNMKTAVDKAERLSPDGIRVGAGARLGNIYRDVRQGAVKTTDRALDTALLKQNDLFQIQVTNNGHTETQYTRDGAFYLSPDGDGMVTLTTKNGNPVLGAEGPITFNDDMDGITIQSDGTVMTKHGDRNEMVGKLQVVETSQPQLLESAGNNAYRLPNARNLAYQTNDIIHPLTENRDILKSGALEQSNVDMGEEMTDMITTQRSYQFNARTITMGDEMAGLVNQLR